MSDLTFQGKSIYRLYLAGTLKNLLQNIVRDLFYIIEGQVKPGDVFGALHQVQGQLVQAVRVDQVVV